MTAQYLLRFDDLCPTMNRENWRRARDIVMENGVKAIIAIVPDNQDPKLCLDCTDPTFWEEMRRLQASGWTIAQHGHQHTMNAKGRGFVPLHEVTEFAGLPGEEQFRKLRIGQELLRSQGLEPSAWVAPRHGFDKATVCALRSLGITCISDGFTLSPFLRDEMFWIPQQVSYGVSKQFGVWTICLHANTMTDSDFVAIATFIQTHRDQFTTVQAVRERYGRRKASMLDAAFEFYWSNRPRFAARVSASPTLRALRRLLIA